VDLEQHELTERIIGSFYDVYNELGHGFLESVYEQALAIALAQAGAKVERQVPVLVSGTTGGRFSRRPRGRE
jgi:GxxExxY protein